MLAFVALLAFPKPDLKSLEAAVKRQPNAANYRALADAYVKSEQFEKASAAFFKAGALYGKLGDRNAAKVLQTYGERYETTIELFYERPTRPETVRANYTGARLEPGYGCYVGAFIDREDGLDTGFVGNGQSHKDPEGFNEATGKRHAMFFTYLAYGRPFPSRWVSVLRQRGAAAHIVWEPKSTSAVRDDRYLQRFAQDCANSRVPIFLRFAGEMNGDWTPYHSDPDAYRRMFQSVSNVMHRVAPNVAMVWCPNDIPEDRITAYYPGREAVDWVGVNFYSVLYNDGDRARSADWRNPADSLRFVYHTYSRIHPIMVGEWAATHLSVVDRVEKADFAEAKIAQLYTALPRLYPRVKAVNWLSMNTIEHAMPGRQLNDFSLLANPSVASMYRGMVAPAYFLSTVVPGSTTAAPSEYASLHGAALSGKVKLSAVVKSYEQRPTVIWSVDSDPASPKTAPGSYDVSVDFSKLRGSKASISLIVKDSKGRIAGRRDTSIDLSHAN
jgi:hypothetical protein